MPLVLDTPRSPDAALPATSETIEIALLNNLGDSGLETGERQIIDLLSGAAGSRTVRLRFFSLPEIARSDRARSRIETGYTRFEALTTSRVDGLIVTGCEPRARRLSEEPFWRHLTDVIDWAEHNTRSTIWSCLAAHAAILHLDGIERVPLARKCTGIFPVRLATLHPLTRGMKGALQVAHSRYNGLSEADLVASGYTILSRSQAIGVDTAIKQWRSLFVYLQGHPEYDARAIAREYKRDVLRFLDRESPAYPTLPSCYFKDEAEAALLDFERRAGEPGASRLATPFPAIAGFAHRPYQRGFARTLFANWLDLIGGPPGDHGH